MDSTAAGGQSISRTAIAMPAYRPSAHPIVRIHLLGAIRATSYLGDDVLPRPKKARAALGYLCLAAGARVSRARLASMLWDRASASQARTSLRQVVSELTLALGPLAPELIAAGRASIHLNTDLCWIDALALVKSSCPDATRADLAVLCAGELLEGLGEVSAAFGQWLSRERIRLRERLAGSLHTALEQTDRPGFDPKQVAALAHRLISVDPTHQGASRALMRALVKLGEREEALREYERCRQALAQAFRVKPALESERLYETIRARPPRKRANRGEASTDPRCNGADIHQPLPGRQRLRVGVLPFDANDAENERDLAFSLSHDIATALARLRWFDVITPVSMLDRPVASLLSNDLFQQQQLDYAIDGVIKRQGRNYDINVRLLDLARCTRPAWSDRFELGSNELHRLNEMVTGRVVARIDPVILFIEGRPRRKERYGATGLLFLAIPLIYSMERSKFQEAGQLIERAIAIEPDNAMALTWSAYWHLWNAGQCWTPDLAAALLKAEGLCLRAMKLDPENSEAFGIYAHTLAWKKDFEQAVHFFDRSLRLNPNVAYIWALSAPTYCYIGKPEEALWRLGRYRYLVPFDPYFGFFENAYAMAYLFKRDYERAAVVGRRVVKANPDFVNGYKPLIAALGHLCRRDEAAPYLDKLLSLEPDFTIERFRKVYPFKVAEDCDNYCRGLLLAGIPKR
ncbi:MAG TPA: BTAD domain-containing putative transcriptional regulator [Xanthobacteraceae bacterium]|nr:BTAD domain-containing putative transcriptional regulator [Xanthobacteraceae bacterium]